MVLTTIKDWVDKWIKDNGETTGIEVEIRKSKLEGDSIYEGSFSEIPKVLYLREVITSYNICASSDESREGAFILIVK